MKGSAILLKLESSDEKVHRYADEICQSADSSADLVRQLLSFARKGNTRATSVDVHEVVTTVFEMLTRSIDKRIRLESSLEAETSAVVGDPTQLQSALLNLGLNARDAMPHGGCISVRTRLLDFSEASLPELRVTVPPGTYLHLEFSDTGTGIEPESLGLVFEPFFTTKPHGEGVGLGLAAVYGTVKAHSGFITVRSEDQGTTFDIYLPLASTLVAPMPGANEQATSTATRLQIGRAHV